MIPHQHTHTHTTKHTHTYTHTHMLCPSAITNHTRLIMGVYSTDQCCVCLRATNMTREENVCMWRLGYTEKCQAIYVILYYLRNRSTNYSCLFPVLPPTDEDSVTPPLGLSWKQIVYRRLSVCLLFLLIVVAGIVCRVNIHVQQGR